MSKLNRQAVTLRFSHKDIKLMELIIKKEFGPGHRLERGLRQIILNIMQQYINELDAELRKNGTNDTNLPEAEVRTLPDVDSGVVADPNNDVD